MADDFRSGAPKTVSYPVTVCIFTRLEPDGVDYRVIGLTSRGEKTFRFSPVSHSAKFQEIKDFVRALIELKVVVEVETLEESDLLYRITIQKTKKQ